MQISQITYSEETTQREVYSAEELLLSSNLESLAPEPEQGKDGTSAGTLIPYEVKSRRTGCEGHSMDPLGYGTEKTQYPRTQSGNAGSRRS